MKKWLVPFKTLSLKAKLVLGVLCSLTIGLGITAIYSYLQIENEVRANYGTRIMEVAKSAGLLLNPQKHAQIVESYLARDPKVAEMKEFRELQWVLQQVHRAHDLNADIATFVRPDWKPDTMVYIVMNNAKAYLGNGIPLTPPAAKTMEKGVATYSKVFQDKSGSWISGYAPLIDRNGKVIAGIVADYHLEKVLEQAQSRWMSRTGAPLLGSLVLVLSLFLLVLSTAMKPFQQLKQVAESLAAGNHGARFNLNSNDELGMVATEMDKVLDMLTRQKVKISDEFKSLEKKTSDRTSQLNDKSRLLETLSTVLHEGFLVFDSMGRLVELPSLAADQLLERGQDSVYLWDVLHLPETELKPSFQNFFREKVTFSDVARTLPRDVETPSKKHLTLEYHPVRDDSSRVIWVAITIRDKTLESAATEFAETERNRVLLSKNRLRYPRQLKEALLDVRAGLGKMKQLLNVPQFNASLVVSFVNHLSTMREIADQFTLQPLLSLSAHFESEFVEFEEAPDAITRAVLPRFGLCVRELEKGFEDFLRTNEDILGKDFLLSDAEVVVSKRALRLFDEILAKNPNLATVRTQFDHLLMKEPIWRAFSHLELVTNHLAFQQNKIVAPLMVQGGDEPVDLSESEMFLPWVEAALKNAVVHGLETKRDREAKGKPPEGKITLSFAVSGNEQPWLSVVISDDGRGLDPALVKKKAESVGIDTSKLSAHETLQLVFRKELWATADQEAEVPGLAWIFHEVSKLGGVVELDSIHEKSTSLSIFCPLNVQTLKKAA